MIKVRPYITEKSIKLAESHVYTLLVEFNATRGQIEQSVIEVFGFKPIEINVIKGKYRETTRLRKPFLDRGVKKALIKLKKDQKIPGFELAQEQPKEEKTKSKEKVAKTKEVKETK